MKIFVLIFAAVIIGCLIAERALAIRHRRAIKHVIHVNGTRGKSSVTRLIAAGLGAAQALKMPQGNIGAAAQKGDADSRLQAGGLRVFCKTTGTLPMTINGDGEEKLIARRGPANISEQIRTLKWAADDGADALVAECMAVSPELAWTCEHKIFHSDVSVITNARVDHVAEMGESTDDVALALSNTVPERGPVFTADAALAEFLKEKFANDVILADGGITDEEFAAAGIEPEKVAFPENYALALAVCEYLGVSRGAALAGMSRFKPDPYDAAAYELPGGAVFVNAMSANDPQSTGMLLDRYRGGAQTGAGDVSHGDHPKSIGAVEPTENGRLYIVLNCRADRGYRTKLMIDFIKTVKPDGVYLMGDAAAAGRRLRTFAPKTVTPRELYEVMSKDAAGDMYFAIGNIARGGMELMNLVEKGGKICTRR